MKSYSRRVESHKYKGISPLLGSLDLEITERCNNNCLHCYINLPAHDLPAKERELSTEEIGVILKEAVSLDCLTVRFTGGEPLLREDFEDLYVLARKLGLKVIIFTNAVFINPRLARLFERMPPLQKIEVTVYGMSKKSYEAVTRIPGSFEAARRGMGLLLENKVPFVVKGALLPPNRGEMEEFEAWAATIPWMDQPPSYSMFFDLRCRQNQEERNRLIKGLRLSPEEGVKILTRKREEYFKGMKAFCSKFMHPSGDDLFRCGAGVGKGCVDAYGQFQLCMLLRHPDAVCDLKSSSLEEALTHFVPKIRQMKAHNPVYLTRCARCFLMGLCEQCPGKSWMEYGTLDTPVEYLCEIAHEQARYLGLLEDGEMSWEVADWEERLSGWLNRSL